jgi:tetratricopeptide (TPR) repeat protein
MIRFHAGEIGRAEALFATALKEDRYNLAALLYAATTDLDLGRPQEARRRLRLAMQTTAGGHAITRLYLADAELRTGELKGAQARLQDLVETEPALIQARYLLGVILRKQGEEEEGRKLLEAVVRTDPDFLPAKQALAR